MLDVTSTKSHLINLQLEALVAFILNPIPESWETMMKMTRARSTKTFSTNTVAATGS